MAIVDIKEILDNHIDKVSNFMLQTSDIIKIMDFISAEINTLEIEIEKLIDGMDDDLFFLLTISGVSDKLKEIEGKYLEEYQKILIDINSDFSRYLNLLTEKRMINDLDKVILLKFTEVILEFVYSTSNMKYMIKRLEDYKSKIYRK